MKGMPRKTADAALLGVGTKMHDSMAAAPAASEFEAKEDGNNFKFGLFNGALAVMPFWILVIWLIAR
ncbi:hypothetical protein SAMN02799624_00742 [Paenibacillus sp. UNC496MF]|uniref:hypothetical protein n=1 Tax=Paenibacillus sp. UNC496MF TaxID=1502753 RepID=UPI0008E80E33|nr:hypothetical protein [Paenibacillus sp. UNC496MF]SFI38642.1 hypothetical protein SAMN02799624_00742 [Paenibacillus sp. UNC496MF]